MFFFSEAHLIMTIKKRNIVPIHSLCNGGIVNITEIFIAENSLCLKTQRISTGLIMVNGSRVILLLHFGFLLYNAGIHYVTVYDYRGLFWSSTLQLN